MFLLIPIIIHVVRNSSSLASSMRCGIIIAPLALMLLAGVPSAVYALSDAGQGVHPAFREISVVSQARVSDLAPVLKTTPEALLTTLRQHGYSKFAADQTLTDIAAASGKRTADVLFVLLSDTKLRGDHHE